MLEKVARKLVRQHPKIGREFDLQELHINLISLSGNLDETDDELTLSWNS